jgi:23S rRNA pseudouridine1911/1915/1917 synthase
VDDALAFAADGCTSEPLNFREKMTKKQDWLEPETEETTEEAEYPSQIDATEDDAGTRLDQFLVAHLPDVSRVRVQQLIDEGKVLVNERTSKSSLKLRGTEHIEITGKVQPEPLKAIAEDIPLDVVFEDKDLAVVNKPAGMMVNAGAGASDDERNRGTLVNALLFRFNKLSDVGGELRPGIVHRLDRDTSGLIVVAKNDVIHRKLAEQFSGRKIDKRYLALVHGWPSMTSGKIDAPIQRDRKNPTRMTTLGSGGRDAVSKWKVIEKVESGYGKFALVEVKIETGRTHQIRVHMSSIGHPVVGDTLYGAPGVLSPHTANRERSGNAISLRNEAKRMQLKGEATTGKTLRLTRNFLHAAQLEFEHPRSKKKMELKTELPDDLRKFYELLKK